MLRPLLLLWLWGRLRALTQGTPAGTAPTKDVVDLEFYTKRLFQSVSPSFLSITIDASLATDPRFLTFLGSPRLRALARGLSPAYLRFGGTKTDFLIFDPNKEPTSEERSYWQSQDNNDICGSERVSADVLRKLQMEWPFQELLLLREQYQREFKNSTYSRSSVDMLYSFAKCSRLDLIFGLNALLRTPDLRWNSSNAQLLLNYCSSKGYNISWELGNEPNSFWKKAQISIDGLQLGEDFVELHKLLQKSAFQNAKLYGPDIGQPRGKTVKLLRSFLKAGGEVIDSLTWHHYYLNGRVATKEDFLSSDVLDTFILSVQKILKVTKEMTPGKKVWLGETSSAYGGGAPLLSNTFAAGFMWLDKLGLSAQLGIEVVMRQVFFGAGNYHLVDENFEPLPDYWLSLLFKKLVGPKVLMSRVKGPDRSKLRVYLHCTNVYHPRYREGDLTLYVLNLHNVTKHLKLPPPMFSRPVDKYLLKPFGSDGLLSKSVQLNGQTLKMVDEQTLPALTEKPLPAGSSLSVPAFSYGFFVIRNAKIAACI
ncbi:heparanase precursor [Rattus norvegicus]|uniref:heparanase precursor n=1 Tax=Rattus norvegicus TaxID=10116 RepID=UPI00000E6813|nr:heparanase precursor [Rattus norvegicus]AAF04563.1 heparanase [Rattus norvegicus]|eukprot:NP_072127.1 heparanase precursor [Rattus norvegicus]